MIKLFNKVLCAIKGFLFAIKTELSFQIEMLLGIVLFIFGYLMWPLTQFEISLLFLSWVLLLITELQNTAIETALNRLHPERHENIGKSKDLAASSVLIALIFMAFVIGMILYSHIL